MRSPLMVGSPPKLGMELMARVNSFEQQEGAFLRRLLEDLEVAKGVEPFVYGGKTYVPLAKCEQHSIKLAELVSRSSYGRSSPTILQMASDVQLRALNRQWQQGDASERLAIMRGEDISHLPVEVELGFYEDNLSDIQAERLFQELMESRCAVMAGASLLDPALRDRARILSGGKEISTEE